MTDLAIIQRGNTKRIITNPLDGRCHKIAYTSMAKAKKVVRTNEWQKHAYACGRCGKFHTTTGAE